ncbi:hypothetical protein AOLI_G00064110 [Acnodon oligacanthus]
MLKVRQSARMMLCSLDDRSLKCERSQSGSTAVLWGKKETLEQACWKLHHFTSHCSLTDAASLQWAWCAFQGLGRMSPSARRRGH